MPVMITSLVWYLHHHDKPKWLNFFSCCFWPHAYWNGIQLTKKRIIDEMNQKSNKGFVITTDVTSITYYFE